MAKIMKFIYIMIIFMSLFFIAKNVDGRPFYYFQPSLFTLYTLFYPFLVILFYFFGLNAVLITYF
jgi:hypothetical protein